MDLSLSKEWNKFAQANLHLKKKKKKSAGREWIVKRSPKNLACEEKATTNSDGGTAATPAEHPVSFTFTVASTKLNSVNARVFTTLCVYQLE